MAGALRQIGLIPNFNQRGDLLIVLWGGAAKSSSEKKALMLSKQFGNRCVVYEDGLSIHTLSFRGFSGLVRSHF